MQIDWKNLPADVTSSERVGSSGFEYRVIDTEDAETFGPYLYAETRGFLSDEQTAEQQAGLSDALAFRRFTGVYDPAALHPLQPVGTVNSWITPLTMPGGAEINMWAISGVTVAPTHRRRGIARAMLEGELRTAANAGLALAGLTVTESTIYGRYGFSPATFAGDWTIDTRRVTWAGPKPQGRLDFIDRDRLAGDLAELHARVRRARPGEVDAWPGLWRRMAGMSPGQEGTNKLRAVRYADVAGVTRGIVVYRVTEDATDYTRHTLAVHHLISETDDAYAALWRFVLEHDLVATVTASLRPVDDPLRWMISDHRAAKVETSEHEYLRILDVPAVLAARSYGDAGTFVLRVVDPLGLADGTWRVRVEAGAATISATEEPAEITLSVGALSSLLLGGVRAHALATAGLIEAEAQSLTALDAAFAVAIAPNLSLWY